MSQPIFQSLQRLRAQHHALYPPYLLTFPTPSILAQTSSQAFLVDQILYDPEIEGYRPDVGYRKKFWRRVLDVLEVGLKELLELDPECEVEVDERFYEVMAGWMISDSESSAGPSTLPGKSCRTFIYDAPSGASNNPCVEERKITLLEEQVAVQAGTTGLRTWTAALHLAHHILHHPNILRKEGSKPLSPIIELGAGTGFLSILLSQLGFEVIATDLGEKDGVVNGDEEGIWRTPLKRLKDNISLNRLDNPPKVVALDWMDALRPREDRPAIWKEWAGGTKNGGRTVVAADVIYDPDLIPALVSTIKLMLGSSTSTDGHAVIAATVRNLATLHLFTTTCAEQGLQVTVLDLEPMNPLNPSFWDSALDRDCEVRIMRIQQRENG